MLTCSCGFTCDRANSCWNDRSTGPIQAAWEIIHWQKRTIFGALSSHHSNKCVYALLDRGGGYPPQKKLATKL